MAVTLQDRLVSGRLNAQLQADVRLQVTAVDIAAYKQKDRQIDQLQVSGQQFARVAGGAAGIDQFLNSLDNASLSTTAPAAAAESPSARPSTDWDSVVEQLLAQPRLPDVSADDADQVDTPAPADQAGNLHKARHQAKQTAGQPQGAAAPDSQVSSQAPANQAETGANPETGATPSAASTTPSTQSAPAAAAENQQQPDQAESMPQTEAAAQEPTSEDKPTDDEAATDAETEPIQEPETVPETVPESSTDTTEPNEQPESVPEPSTELNPPDSPGQAANSADTGANKQNPATQSNQTMHQPTRPGGQAGASSTAASAGPSGTAASGGAAGTAAAAGEGVAAGVATGGAAAVAAATALAAQKARNLADKVPGGQTAAAVLDGTTLGTAKFFFFANLVALIMWPFDFTMNALIYVNVHFFGQFIPSVPIIEFYRPYWQLGVASEFKKPGPYGMAVFGIFFIFELAMLGAALGPLVMLATVASIVTGQILSVFNISDVLAALLQLMAGVVVQ